MACRSDYMEASSLEIEGSRVLTFLDEIKRGIPPSPNYLRGYHPEAYSPCLSPKILNEKTAELCELCEQHKISSPTFSLELQIWWRDHQRGEERRKFEDACELKQNDLRKSGLSKLTSDERKALKL